MSLVTTPTLRVLYNLANTIGAKEHASTTFWNHWLNKIIFPEEHFVVAPERPPSNDNEDGNRRVDFIVGFADVSQLRFIYIFEGKKAKGGITAAESQVQEASAACCRRGGSVWSMTAVGTKARIWKYTTVPVSSLGSVTAYIDADSPQASQLSSNMMVVKSMMAPQSDFILKSQPSVTTTQSPSSSTTPVGRYTAAHMDGKWHWDAVNQGFYHYDNVSNRWVTDGDYANKTS